MPSLRGGSRTQNRLVVILGVVGILLGFLAFTGPWWGFAYQNVGPMMGGQTATYGLFGWTVAPYYSPATPSGTKVSDYSGLLNTGTVFLLGTVLTASGVFAASGMAVLALVPTFRLRRWRNPLAILSFILTLAAPLSVMALLPGAIVQDTKVEVSGFWGSATYYTGTPTRMYESWGAGWAWYAVLVAAVLFLIAGIVLFRTESESAGQETSQRAQQS